MPNLELVQHLSVDTDEPTILLATEGGGGPIRCRRCGRDVDLQQSCNMAHGSDGRVHITACHLCLTDPRREVNEAIATFVVGLATQVGPDIVLAALADLPSVPQRGSAWTWRSVQTPDVKRLTFDRVYGDGKTLRFENIDGTLFTCSLRDWVTWIKSGQAEPRS
ncbi:MAG TPA: hypothetical protein VJV75_03705 [Candidatus Polarisedimenticolia bacterium]|nr:hypothetical protein [Candidatus Polarisedimenticolia bacterium]